MTVTKEDIINMARNICVAYFEKLAKDSPDALIFGALMDIRSTNDVELLTQHFSIVRQIMDNALTVLKRDTIC